MTSDYQYYRGEINQLVALARQQLNEQECDRIRVAVEDRKGDWRQYVEGHASKALADRFVAALADADLDLPPQQVVELKRMIDDGLPRFG